MPRLIAFSRQNSPGAFDDGALLNLPLLQHAFDIRLESGGKRLLDLILITQIVTFCHRGPIDIGEQWREPLDIVGWLPQQLRDGDGVMQALRQPQ